MQLNKVVGILFIFGIGVALGFLIAHGDKYSQLDALKKSNFHGLQATANLLLHVETLESRIEKLEEYLGNPFYTDEEREVLLYKHQI